MRCRVLTNTTAVRRLLVGSAFAFAVAGSACSGGDSDSDADPTQVVSDLCDSIDARPTDDAFDQIDAVREDLGKAVFLRAVEEARGLGLCGEDTQGGAAISLRLMTED
jgi:hypothetical protein